MNKESKERNRLCSIPNFFRFNFQQKSKLYTANSNWIYLWHWRELCESVCTYRDVCAFLSLLMCDENVCQSHCHRPSVSHVIGYEWYFWYVVYRFCDWWCKSCTTFISCTRKMWIHSLIGCIVERMRALVQHSFSTTSYDVRHKHITNALWYIRAMCVPKRLPEYSYIVYVYKHTIPFP